MVCPRPSFLTEYPSLLLVSRSNCMLPWGHIWSTIQLIICRPMVTRRGWTKFLKICSELACWTIMTNGTSVYRWLSFLITTVLGESQNGTLRSVVWPPMSYTSKLDRAWWEDDLWPWPCHWGRGDSPSHPLQPESCQGSTLNLCQQEMATAWVWSWRLCVPSCLTYTMYEAIRDQRQACTTLHRSVSYLG
jgi:hypothetical protein